MCKGSSRSIGLTLVQLDVRVDRRGGTDAVRNRRGVKGVGCLMLLWSTHTRIRVCTFNIVLGLATESLSPTQ